MYHFFVPEENFREKEIIILGDDVNHIKNVLRMEVGEQVTVSAGKGRISSTLGLCSSTERNSV